MTDAVIAPTGRRFIFTGNARDYFRIWIVSVCLSLATIGIYSAWGKVRKKRYLYSHTELDGSGLDYRASPLAILRGRAIALATFGGFALAGHVLPLAQALLVLLLLAATPWIVVASSRFNARNTTWRNVAFAFDGTIGEAAKVLIGFGLAAIATLGILYPYYRMRRARFVIERHRFGATPLAAELRTGDFFVVYLMAGLMLIGAGVLMSIGGAGAFVLGGPVAGVAVIVSMYAAYLVVYAFVRARVSNLIANGTIVASLRCRSTVRVRDLVWLYLSNIVAVIATVGLATPWVTVRMARYRAERLELVGDGALDAFAAAPARPATATGSEVSDLFDVDVSL